MNDLHSSMVRLEIAVNGDLNTIELIFTFQYGQIRNFDNWRYTTNKVLFTFQYGQIRNQQGICRHHPRTKHLHSSMVRLEIELKSKGKTLYTIFTFQYGQIRN